MCLYDDVISYNIYTNWFKMLDISTAPKNMIRFFHPSSGVKDWILLAHSFAIYGYLVLISPNKLSYFREIKPWNLISSLIRLFRKTFHKFVLLGFYINRKNRRSSIKIESCKIPYFLCVSIVYLLTIHTFIFISSFKQHI